MQTQFDVTVQCFLFEKTDNLFEDVVDIQDLDFHIHPAGESQQTVGYCAAPFDRLNDSSDQGQKLFFIGKAWEVPRSGLS